MGGSPKLSRIELGKNCSWMDWPVKWLSPNSAKGMTHTGIFSDLRLNSTWNPCCSSNENLDSDFYSIRSRHYRKSRVKL